MESIMAGAAPGVLVRTTIMVATFLALFVQRSHGAGGAVWLNAHATFYGASDGGGTMGITSFSLSLQYGTLEYRNIAEYRQGNNSLDC
jgi:hypothetical protein